MSVSDGEMPAESLPPVEPINNPTPLAKKIPDQFKVTLVFHINYLKTCSGILNLLQSILGIISISLVSAYYTSRSDTVCLFFLIMSVTFFISSTCFLISCLMSWSNCENISKTMFNFNYHIVATILLFSASLALLIDINVGWHSWQYTGLTATGVIGLINTISYLVSAIFAKRSYNNGGLSCKISA